MSLSSLSSLSPLQPNITPQQAASAVGTAANAAVNAATGFSGLTIAKGVTILIGLLLLGAGLFSIDKTREILLKAGKGAAAAAA